MFVTMQCFNNLNEEEEKKPMTERFGMTMRRAGAAITITSLTDFLAFAVGGTTVSNGWMDSQCNAVPLILILDMISSNRILRVHSLLGDKYLI